MALGGGIVPWINVGPTDYLHAIQAGTQAGLEVSRMRSVAEEAAARRMQAQQDAQRQAWEFGERLRQQAQLAEMENERQAQYQSGMLDWRREQMRMDAEKAAAGDREAQARLNETIRHNQAIEQLGSSKLEADVMPSEWQRDPTKEYVTKGGAYIPTRGPLPTEVQTVTEKLEATPEIPAVPAQPAEKRSLLGIDWLMPDKPAIPATAYQPAYGERTITRKVPVGLPIGESSLTNALPQMGTNAPPSNVSALKDQAQAAIAAGAPEDAVRKRFRELTGQELD